MDAAIEQLQQHRDILARDRAALTLHAYINNVIKEPGNQKFRRIRLVVMVPDNLPNAWY